MPCFSDASQNHFFTPKTTPSNIQIVHLSQLVLHWVRQGATQAARHSCFLQTWSCGLFWTLLECVSNLKCFRMASSFSNKIIFLFFSSKNGSCFLCRWYPEKKPSRQIKSVIFYCHKRISFQCSRPQFHLQLRGVKCRVGALSQVTQTHL